MTTTRWICLWLKKMTNEELKYRNLFIEYWKMISGELQVTEQLLEAVEGFLDMIHKDMAFEFEEKDLYRQILITLIGNNVLKTKINDKSIYISVEGDELLISAEEDHDK